MVINGQYKMREWNDEENVLAPTSRQARECSRHASEQPQSNFSVGSDHNTVSHLGALSLTHTAFFDEGRGTQLSGRTMRKEND
jgi:hypothetical protein